jgi:sulfhydrogenase subunit beta (sulfur reductase)
MKFMSVDQWSDFIHHLSSETRLIGPRQIEGILLYQPVAAASEIEQNFSRPQLSLKEFFFPATEQLLTISMSSIHGNPDIHLKENFDESHRVIYGVRPCDARGIQMLDAVFMHTDPVDPHYAARRENTTLIGLACKEAGTTCFCTSMGGAPDANCDVDLMLHELVNGYAVDIVTEKGAALLAGQTYIDHTGPLPDKATIADHPIPAAGKWPENFGEAIWRETAERCIGCRLCAYVCPTCRCFDVRDEALSTGAGYERIRVWDSCTRDGYRLLAGGHNTRPEKEQRLRNRFFCKFDYFEKQYASSACTGCGRCIEACPVQIDITEVLEQLAQEGALV